MIFLAFFSKSKSKLGEITSCNGSDEPGPISQDNIGSRSTMRLSRSSNRPIILVGNAILRVVGRVLNGTHVGGNRRVFSSVYYSPTVDFVDVNSSPVVVV